jgi:hypothetical protein
VLRLTPADFFQSGSAFTSTAVPLGNQASFSTYFQFRMSNAGGLGDGDGPGADGIVFVVQTVANNVGASGGGLGYQGINNSLGIEFDSFDNGTGAGDPNGNHAGVDLNGSVFSVATALEPNRWNDGQIWNAWVDYNGTTHLIEVRWSLTSSRPGAAQLSFTQDLTAILGQTSAFVGFTAGTGSGVENQDILHWEFRQSFSPIGAGPLPEPASVTLAGLGAVGLLAYRWRKRRAA